MMGDETRTDTHPTDPLGHMDALPSGTMLGEFELQGLLGVGGFGMVYRGYDHSLHRAVAIKEYMPSALVGRASGLLVSARSSADTQSFLTGLASFMAEARLLAQFDHPSLVKVYRVWEENNTAYMVMPLYSGITLKQARSAMSGPPPEDWLRAVLWSILEALKVLHANGTLHRDVSPDNIFLQDVGPPVLLDLGAARHAVIESSRKHTAILKVNYAPIEQYADAHGLNEGPWTDLYALAAVIHGCLCNEPPLPATFRMVRDRMPPISAVVKTVETHFGQTYSRAFVRAISHALVIQPDKRTRDVEAFARDMRLRTPKYMARFDWRARLGDGVSVGEPPKHNEQQAHLPTRPHHLNDRTQPAAVSQTVRIGSGGASRWRRPAWVGLGMLVIGGVLVAAYFGGSTHNQAEPAVPVAVVVPPPAVITEIAVASEPPPSPLPDAVPDVAVVESARSRSLPVAQEKITVSVHKAPTTNIKREATVAPRVAQPVPRTENRVLCADSGMLTRTMCVYRECQKPENTDLLVCVEDRKRWEKRDKERLP